LPLPQLLTPALSPETGSEGRVTPAPTGTRATFRVTDPRNPVSHCHFTLVPQQAAQSASHKAQLSQLVPQSAHGVAQQLAVAAGAALAAQQACGAAAGTAITAAAGAQQAEQSVAQSAQPSHPPAQAGQGVAQQVGAVRVAAV
jgi:hypothetical protein